ncbi:MAG: DNA polymerase III subunit beta [Lysobacteraceae bacterium]|nr:MAG: DNA polymerase III subunit beta [Xanthomonadaceae bacterium]
MKFSIQREVLLRPLSQVVGVVERRQTLPVLANLLVVAREGELRLTGTDLEVELVASTELEIEQEGEVTIPARKWLDICRALPDGTTINMSLAESKMTLRGGSSRFTLSTLPASEFPTIDDVETNDQVQIEPKSLKQAIEHTAFAMAQQDVRYYLNGMLLELRADGVRCVATDGHRLAISEVEASIEIDDMRQIIVPRKGIVELQRLLDSGDEFVTVRIGRNHVRVILGSSVFTSKLIDGRFPDYESVIPIGADLNVDVDRVGLLEALNRAAILSNEKYRGVKFELKPGSLRIVAHNPEQEEAVEDLQVEHSVSDLAVGFNVGYVQDALGSLDGDEVRLRFKDSNSSCLISEVEHTKTRHVVMPLRL